MQKLALVLCLVLVSSIALGRSIESKSITIDVDANGNAVVVEAYTISLDPTTDDYITYDQVSATAKNDLTKWQQFIGGINPALYDYTSLLITSSKQRNFVQINLQYDAKNFAVVSEQKGRFTVFSIGKEKFTFYYPTTQVFTIPFKNTLWLRLNKDYTIIDTKPIPSLGPYLENNDLSRIGWVGPLPSNEFSVKYQVETSISESFDVGRIMVFFVDTPVYGIAVIIILVLGYIYRKQLWGLISEGFAGEEEIEAPKREL